MPSEDTAYARWRRLLYNPHFTAAADLQPGARTWQWLSAESVSAVEEERIRRQWERTTPQGREIIRKKLFALNKKIAAEKEEAAQANSQCTPACPGTAIK
jgi:hypothetical protein